MPRLRNRTQLTEASKPPERAMSSRRAAAAQHQERETSPQRRTSVTIARDSSGSPGDRRPSIRLTLKMPSSKLREATSGNRGKPASLNSQDSLGAREMVTGPRSSRAKRSVIIDSGSDDDDDDVENIDEDAEGEDEDELGEEDEEMEEEEGEEDEEEDAEGEEVDEEEDAEGESDVDMADASLPPPPIIRQSAPPSNPKLMVTPAPTKGQVKSVEAKELLMAHGGASDEDLSDLPEDDAEGEEIGEDEAMADLGGDAEGDSDDDLSRDSTPDLTKLTKRQRGRAGDAAEEHFMSLNMGRLWFLLQSILYDHKIQTVPQASISCPYLLKVPGTQLTKFSCRTSD